MAIWLVRSRDRGQFEEKFISEERIYVTWDQLNVDLDSMTEREELVKKLGDIHPDSKPKKILNWASQVWSFVHRMKTGDWVVMPSKQQPSIFVGEIDGEYKFDPHAKNPFFHWRSVKWIGESIP